MTIGSRWRPWSLRERALIVLGIVVVIVGAGWPLLWAPIERDVERSPVVLARARAEAASARRLADDAATLERKAATPRTNDLAAAVGGVIARQALRDKVASSDASDGRVRVTFASIDLVSLAAFAEAVGRDEQLFVREAVVAARVEPGLVRAELTLARDSK